MRNLFVLIALLAAAVAPPAFAQEQKVPLVDASSKGIAIKGYDTVAYFEQSCERLAEICVHLERGEVAFCNGGSSRRFRERSHAVRTSVRRLLHVRHEPGSRCTGGSGSLEDRRRQALSELQQGYPEGVVQGHPGPHSRGQRELAKAPSIETLSHNTSACIPSSMVGGLVHLDKAMHLRGPNDQVQDGPPAEGLDTHRTGTPRTKGLVSGACFLSPLRFEVSDTRRIYARFQ